MDQKQVDFLLKVAESLKEEAKKYYLKKMAAYKILEQYTILKELERANNA